MEALKFREMPYERPDGEALKTSMRTLTEKLRAAGSYEAAKAVFLEKETLSKHIQTLATLAQHPPLDRHARRVLRRGERFWNSFYPGAGGVFDQAWTSGDARQRRTARTLKRNTATLMFLNAEIALKTFSPAIIPELQQENDLTTGVR